MIHFASLYRRYFTLLVLTVSCLFSWGLSQTIPNVNVGKIIEARLQNDKGENNNLDGTVISLPKSDSSKDQLGIQKNVHAIFKLLQNIEDKACARDLGHVLTGLINRERWALKIFDSLPKFPVGILYGNMYQLGNYDECISVEHTFIDNSVIQGQYCLADIAFKLKENGTSYMMEADKKSRNKFNSSIIHWGICLPSTCSSKEASLLITQVFSSFIEFQTLEVNLNDKSCYYPKPQHIISTGDIIYGSIIILFLIFILFATIIHLKDIKNRKRNIAYNIERVRENQLSTGKEMLLAFSLIQTINKFLHCAPSDLNLECLAGIKFLSMCCILAGHSLIFIFGGPIANVDFTDKMLGLVENSIFLNGPLMVNSFLMLSGFLMSMLLLIELNKRNGKVNFLVLYIARYLRLTPAYLVVIGFYVTLLPKIGDGPLWNGIVQTESERCVQSWWTNILYINNYVQTEALCMFQSWFLAADFHLFICAPFFIYLIWRWQKWGLTVLSLFILASIVLPGFITYHYNLDPTFLAFPTEIQDLSTNYYFANVYIKTHMRANTYLLGIAFGFLVNWMQDNGVKISDSVRIVGWLIATVFSVCSMCSINIFLNRELSVLERALYSSLHHVAWALAIGWIILLCVTENAGIINQFLSWKLFIPLSRLTYCVYLVNGIVIIWHKGSTREAISWTRPHLVFVLGGHIVVTFAIAFLLCICFESPIHGLEKILLRRDASNKKSSSTTVLRVIEENENS